MSLLAEKPLREQAQYDMVFSYQKRDTMKKKTQTFVLRKATEKDTEDLMHIYNEAKKGMKAMEIDQWKEDGEPNRNTIKRDLLHQCLWVLHGEKNRCIATAAIIETLDPDYADENIQGAWINKGKA